MSMRPVLRKGQAMGLSGIPRPPTCRLWQAPFCLCGLEGVFSCLADCRVLTNVPILGTLSGRQKADSQQVCVRSTTLRPDWAL